MKTLADQLRQELALIAQQHAASPTLPRVFPPELIERVVQFVRQQARMGQSLASCSQQLGVPRLRLHYWVYKRTRPPASASGPALLRPVQLSSELVQVTDGVPERRYTLRSPAGWQLGDLRFPELVQLLRTLV